jgi:hypothetical protein
MAAQVGGPFQFAQLWGRDPTDPHSTSPKIRMTVNEAKTRVLHIDPQLRAADWKLNDRTQVRLEVPSHRLDASIWTVTHRGGTGVCARCSPSFASNSAPSRLM